MVTHHGSSATNEAEDEGPLVFQRGKKLNGEYYVISVRDNFEAGRVKFTAYELESSDAHHLPYRHDEFDALFRTIPELVNPANKEGRYDWVVDRIEFTVDSASGGKKLELADEPTVDDGVGGLIKTPISAPKAMPKDRLTFAERTRLRLEAERLEEKRAANIALKAEKNRKAFAAELEEKKKIDEVKAASRQQRINEDRAERREKTEVAIRLQEEKKKLYDENHMKRECKINAKISERKDRDIQSIRQIIEVAFNKQEEVRIRLEAARIQKDERDAVAHEEAIARKEDEAVLDRKRDQQIVERSKRLKEAERRYLEFRLHVISKIKSDSKEWADRKQVYLDKKAVERAAEIQKCFERLEAWREVEDKRLQANIQRERARDQVIVERVAEWRAMQSEEEAELCCHRTAARKERKRKEAREAEVVKEKLQAEKALDEKRDSAIAVRDEKREHNNYKYHESIKELKAQESIEELKQETIIRDAKEKLQQQELTELKQKALKERTKAIVSATRQSNIKGKDTDRDRLFAIEVKKMQDEKRAKKAALEAKKEAKRLQLQENALKHHEETQARRQNQTQLDEQREAAIAGKEVERNKREKVRADKLGGSDGSVDLDASGEVVEEALEADKTSPASPTSASSVEAVAWDKLAFSMF